MQATNEARTDQAPIGINPDIGLRVLYYRKKAKLRQTDLADKAGISCATLRRLEQGTTAISFERAIALARALGITVNELAAMP